MVPFSQKKKKHWPHHLRCCFQICRLMLKTDYFFEGKLKTDYYDIIWLSGYIYCAMVCFIAPVVFSNSQRTQCAVV